MVKQIETGPSPISLFGKGPNVSKAVAVPVAQLRSQLVYTQNHHPYPPLGGQGSAILYPGLSVTELEGRNRGESSGKISPDE